MGDEKTTNSEAPEDEVEPTSPDVQFVPVIQLPEMVPVQTLEEDEDELFKMRAKLYRMDRETEPPEWKERGLGDLRILFHPRKLTYRIVMRREQTYKICANHLLKADMNLIPMKGSDKAYVWFAAADFADEELTPETLAARFKSKEIADAFKVAFDDAVRKAASTPCPKSEPDDASFATPKETEKPEKEEKQEREKAKEEKSEKSEKTEEGASTETSSSSSSKSDNLIEIVASDLDKLNVKAD